MRLIAKLILGIILIILIYAGIRFATHKTGEATATVEFNLTVTPEAAAAPSPAAAGGKGVSAGGGVPACKESWSCTGWGECSASEYQTRSCLDNLFCGTIKDKPSEIQRCNYITRPANCFDSLKNGNEDGIDCGGSCVPCPSCNDGIKNQNETDVDCGGVCGECVIEVSAERKAPGFFSFRVLIKDINIFWPVWLLLSTLLLIFILLYSQIREHIEQHHSLGHSHRHS